MSKKILLYDNFDSFSYLLVDYLSQCGASVTVVKNNQPLSNILLDIPFFDGIVLSPGPSRPEDAGFLEPFLAQIVNIKPILGVCLGHQAIGKLFGLTLEKAIKPMHGKQSLIATKTHQIFAKLPPQFNVCRYHSLVLKGESNELTTIALSEQNEIMALAHRVLPIVGVQFHPEAILTKHGLNIIRNWVESL